MNALWALVRPLSSSRLSSSSSGKGYVMAPGQLAQKGIVVKAFPDKGMFTLTLDYSAPATQTQTP